MASSEWATHNWDMVGNCESEERCKHEMFVETSLTSEITVFNMSWHYFNGHTGRRGAL